jgi:hypothetical protein
MSTEGHDIDSAEWPTTARRTWDRTVRLEHHLSMSNQAYGAGVREYIYTQTHPDDDLMTTM